MATSSVDIPFGGMDLRTLEGVREVTNLQRDREGGLVSRPPLLKVYWDGLALGGIFTGDDVPPAAPELEYGVLLPAPRDDTSAWAVHSGNVEGFHVAVGSPVNPDDPTTAWGMSGISDTGDLHHGAVLVGGKAYMTGEAALHSTVGASLASTAYPAFPTVPAGTPYWVGALPWEPRLVVMRGSRAWMSDLAAYTTFGVDNWLDLWADDGEVFAGGVAWGNYFFIFKQSRFFVLYGTSTDPDGEPVFDYRSVQSAGADPGTLGWGGSVAAGVKGVYYSDVDGAIHVTTGGPGRKLAPPCPSRRHRNLVAHEGKIYAIRTAFKYSDYRGSGFGAAGAPHEARDLVYLFDEDAGEWTRWRAEGNVHRLIPFGPGALLLLVSASLTPLRWVATQYNLDRTGTPGDLMALEATAHGAFATGGLDFGTPGLERRLTEAGLVFANGASTLSALARSQNDPTPPDWDTEGLSAAGAPPYLRAPGGTGTRHWLRARTEPGSATRLSRLQAVVTDPTDMKYRS